MSRSFPRLAAATVGLEVVQTGSETEHLARKNPSILNLHGRDDFVLGSSDV